MTISVHPLAPEHLPRFIGGEDGADPLFTVVVWLLVILLLAVGNLYLKLHALPERMAHKQNNTQLQFIAVLALLALFTHNNIFWVAALLLAVIRFPDVITPINSIADSLAKLASKEERSPPAEDLEPQTANAEKEH
ncbi:MAG: hypothetical protein ABJ013_08075 [Halioglobus sp.]